ncbi:MAG: hypothetical protein ACLR8G_00265 [Faecalibacterium prausnitzii]
MRKTDAFRRAAALLAALSITVSLAAPAFAGTYYIDGGDITITKMDDGRQKIEQNGTQVGMDAAGEETIITTHKKAITTLESDLEGPAAEDTGFGPVVEDNYQPAPPAQPEDAEQPEGADQPESADQPENTDRSEDADQPEGADQPESTDQPKDADQPAQPLQAAPAPAPTASTPKNDKGNGFWGNTITLINNFADTVLNLTLKDVKIDVSDTGSYWVEGKAALSVQGKGNVEIELDGNNELKSGVQRAGLEKNTSTSTGTLTLKDDKEAGSGSLKATGGKYGAGIGGGNYGSGENITITGGRVNATGGWGSAGIGGGNYGRGNYGSGKNITIKGGTVTAKGGDCGAGIGGGDGGYGGYGNGKNITITDGTVTATGGIHGAGIGGGDSGIGEDITITGGTVNADGGDNGAGIGGGATGSGSNVTVSGAAQVTATTGKSDGYYGAGATIGNGGNMTDDGQPVDGEEIQADIRGVTTGYIHHIIYEQDGTTIKREWWEPERPQPNPESPQPTPEDPNAPAGESNEVSLGTPGLHVETLEGDLLPFDAQQQGSTLRVTSNTLAARLHGTRQALEALQEQGVEQIQFVTTLKTTTLSVEDLLAEGGSWFALEHDGLVSRRLSAAQAESLKCWMH